MKCPNCNSHEVHRRRSRDPEQPGPVDRMLIFRFRCDTCRHLFKMWKPIAWAFLPH
jgi:transcriptional regulator NrdR family protein